MRKANEKPARMVTRTIGQIENRRITKAERERLKRLAALPDDQIDTSDIPEFKDRTGWVRVHEHPEHPLHRVLSRLLSIRLPEPDIALAQRLARKKGLTVSDIYQVAAARSARTRARTSRARPSRIGIAFKVTMTRLLFPIIHRLTITPGRSLQSPENKKNRPRYRQKLATLMLTSYTR